ncbi:MAG: hypothetical protein ABH881_02940 [bacterium]
MTENEPKKEDSKLGHGEFVKREDDVDIKDVVVHTMPKRFLNFRTATNKAKSEGIFIIAGGVLILAVILVGAYFFLFKKQNMGLLKTKNEIIVEEEKRTEDNFIQTIPEDKNVIEQEEDSGILSNVDTVDETIEEENTTGDIEKIIINSESASSTNSEEEVQEENTSQIVLDADQDGLGDKEESIFGTRSDLEDSDLDSYSDLTEVLALYNPDGAEKIMVNSGIERYENTAYGYYLYYPKDWSINNVGGVSSIMFNTQDGQFIQVVAGQNTEGRMLDDWYREQFSVTEIKDSQMLVKNGWTAIQNEDGLTVYLTSDKSDRIFTLFYNTGENSNLYYENIFKMMFNSLEIGM